ncbi:hypothetical protein A4X13_0g1523 [Tilletia indica]|uniref:Uncharacterized protein n=1 Tax=Tilletia indica TaxID=43049 RepID=A0A177TMK0_9BASI|nr:hypothetical protein A4X13_0g1523 [Tilletia indica]
MKDHAYGPLGIVAVILAASVLPWHIKAKNSGVLILCSWLIISVACLTINSFIWWNDTEIRCQIWCDISTKITFGAFMGLPCSSVCILRQLEEIGSTRRVRSTAKDRKHQLYFDLGVGVGIPLVYMILHIVNQGHRFDISESIGCFPTYYLTPVAIVLVLVPPVVASTVALIYSFLALRWFVIRRRQFNAVLQNSHTGLNRNRYLRLMAMAGTEALWSFPINVTILVSKFTLQDKPIHPYLSWSDTHFQFSRIDQYTSAFWDSAPGLKAYWKASLCLGRYGALVGCFFLFVFFGTGNDALKFYGAVLRKILPIPSRTQATRKPTMSSSQDHWNIEGTVRTIVYGTQRKHHDFVQRSETAEQILGAPAKMPTELALDTLLSYSSRAAKRTTEKLSSREHCSSSVPELTHHVIKALRRIIFYELNHLWYRECLLDYLLTHPAFATQTWVKLWRLEMGCPM